jgi:NitT/TauT family transport system ATP-binding protein
MVFQEFGLLPWRTVQHNVELGLELKGMAGEARRQVSQPLIEMIGLAGFEGHFPHELSGGMKQRVGLARALATDPNVLLMDEPFAALDAITRDLLHEELERVWRATGRTIVFVTHNVREAARLGQRVVLLSSRPGRVAQEWRIAQTVGRRIESPEVAALSVEITDQLRKEIRRNAGQNDAGRNDAGRSNAA